MKNAIVFSSGTGNTKKLAETIQEKVGDVGYCGKLDDSALEADTIFVGFWTAKFTCTDDVKNFLVKVKNKKIFLFGTAGYDDTQEYFEKILTAVKENVDSSNTIVGEFMSMGKVSANKQKAIAEMDQAKFDSMKAKLEEAESHPNQSDLEKLTAMITALN